MATLKDIIHRLKSLKLYTIKSTPLQPDLNGHTFRIIHRLKRLQKYQKKDSTPFVTLN